MTQRLLLDVNEVAEALGCGRTYVYELIRTGRLHTVKLGRLTKVSLAQLEEFVTHATTTNVYNEGVATSSCSGGRCRRCP